MAQNGSLMPVLRAWRIRCLVPVVAILLAFPADVFGQPANYQIPEQDLARALVTLAVESGQNIVFSPALVAHKRSTPVVGAFSLPEALKLILAASHLQAKIEPDGSIIVVGASQISAAIGEQVSNRGEPSHRPPSPTSAANAAAALGAHVSEVIVTARLLRAFPNLASDALTSRLTAAELEANPGATVLDTLGNLPGVAVINGGRIATNSVQIDLAGRGEGNYASLRGLDASFNLVAINGVEVALSQPYSRAVQLNLLPGAGLARVSVDKSLTADMPGDAIGGVIDFETPSAFDLPGGTHASVSAGGQAEDEAIRYGRPPFGGSLSVEASRVFGAGDSLGVHGGAYYGVESYSNGIVDGIYPAAVNSMFAYRVETAKGASAPGLDPAANLVLTGLDVGLTTGTVQRFGGDLALDWRPSPVLSASLRLTVAQARTDQATYYSQTYGNLVSSTPIGATGLYTPDIQYVQPRYYYETNPELAVLDTLQAGGVANLGRWALRARADASWGETDDPNHFELSGRDPEVAPGLPFGGDLLFASRDHVPFPLLDAAGQAELADAADYGAHRAGELTREYSHQLKSGLKLDADYRLAPSLSLSVGVQVADAVRSHTYRDYTSELLYTTDANDPSLASLGIVSGTAPVAVPGVFDFPLPTINPAKALALFNANIVQHFGGLANAIDGCGALYVNNYNCDTQHGSEVATSAYVMGRLRFGDFEIRPGFRFDYNLIRNRFWILPNTNTSLETPGAFAENHTVYLEPLPRIDLVYRPQALVAYRAAIWKSYVAPAMYQLGGGAQIGNIAGGAANGGATTVLEGNPNLKPVQALNLDLAVDWANFQGGQLSLAGFYKALDHYIYDSVDAFSDPVATYAGDVVVTQPHNGGAGAVYGLDVSGRQRLLALPPPWNGLGVSGAATLERSQVDTLEAGLSPHERLLNQPDVDANIQTNYAKGALSVALTYRYTGAYIVQYGTLGSSSLLDTWVRSAERLNLVAIYQPTFHFKMTFSVANILNSLSYHATIGQHSEAIPSLIYSGPTYILTTKWLY